MITNLSDFKKAPSRLLGRRVVYLYSNKGKATTGRITTISSVTKGLLKLCVAMDDGTILLRSWKSFSLLD